MSSQIIVELREQDINTLNFETGDFEIMLKEPITINEGDIINCKNKFN